MPDYAQRISAIAATGVFLLGGGWLASLASPISAVVAPYGNSELRASTETPKSGAQAPAILAKAEHQPSLQRSMTVRISGVRSDSGSIYVFLYDNEEAFTRYDIERAVDFRKINASSRTMVLKFRDLEQSAYAVSVFHDENDNEEFDLSAGYPLEGYATSGARSAYHEPTFEEASTRAEAVSLSMHYLDL